MQEFRETMGYLNIFPVYLKLFFSCDSSLSWQSFTHFLPSFMHLLTVCHLRSVSVFCAYTIVKVVTALVYLFYLFYCILCQHRIVVTKGIILHNLQVHLVTISYHVFEYVIPVHQFFFFLVH
eukprot:NODE_653_length_5514_cov_0.694552.p5 type:complete len:122 gc:universal NODE_653_length_5514_cov_0.694552:442-807(+)